LYLSAGDLWQALACFEAALALDPNDTATLLAMAKTAKRLES
jgi:Tfp pilus assembly protein PilF